MQLKYKRDTESYDLREWGIKTIKVYRVYADNVAIGYINKDSDNLWCFQVCQDSEWLGGFDTLKECKEWLNWKKELFIK
tara:strand:- start:369 stop:605 length:237 start_codon:yes stop_codon:yes gene_type:complete